MKKQNPISNSVRLQILSGLLSGVFALVFGGCTRMEPIRIGYSAQLTGRQAEVGIQDRNGVQMAVAKINASNGIAGHPVQLIVRDDLGTPEGAREADRGLIKAGVVVIVGHGVSNETMASLPVIDKAHIVLISPTSSAPELNKMSKYFFRVTTSHRVRAVAFAQHIYRSREVTRIAVIYDADNAAYAKSYATMFADRYRSLGGKVTGMMAFSSRTQPDFDPLLSELRASRAEGLLIIASDFDTALIAQRARLIGWHSPLFSAAWAQTDMLVKNGGKAVEGMEVEESYNMNSRSPAFLDFKKRYQARYGTAPNYGAALGYETMMVLAASLQKTGGRSDGLRQALLNTRDFKGLVDTFSFNRNGDAIRPFYIGTIRNGKYVTAESVKPTSLMGMF